MMMMMDRAHPGRDVSSALPDGGSTLGVETEAGRQKKKKTSEPEVSAAAHCLRGSCCRSAGSSASTARGHPGRWSRVNCCVGGDCAVLKLGASVSPTYERRRGRTDTVAHLHEWACAKRVAIQRPHDNSEQLTASDKEVKAASLNDRESMELFRRFTNHTPTEVLIHKQRFLPLALHPVATGAAPARNAALREEMRV
ncbi:unnamed protein product [Lampetra fluviatilis]